MVTKNQLTDQSFVTQLRPGLHQAGIGVALVKAMIIYLSRSILAALLIMTSVGGHADELIPPLDSQSPQMIRVQSELNADDYQSFLKTRTDFLQQAKKALQALKYGFGFGVVIKNHFKFRSERKMTEKLIADAQNWNSSDRDDLLLAIQRSESELLEKNNRLKNLTLTEKSNQVIAGILQSLDHQLCNQASVVAHANEFGMVAALGVQAEGGSRAKVKGWGGLTDFGISIGYNRDDKSLAIQVFHEFEKFQSTQMPMVMIAGAVAKAGFYIANQGQELSAYGTSFYPPMAPGFSTSTNHSFMAGFSSGLTWPPSPLGDMLTYSNKLAQTTLIRMTFSPLTKGFVRIQSGALKQLINLSLVNMKKLVANFNGTESIQCSKLF